MPSLSVATFLISGCFPIQSAPTCADCALDAPNEKTYGHLLTSEKSSIKSCDRTGILFLLRMASCCAVAAGLIVALTTAVTLSETSWFATLTALVTSPPSSSIVSSTL